VSTHASVAGPDPFSWVIVPAVSRKRYRQALLAFALLVGVTRHGAALPALSVRAIGSCPTESAIDSALGERGLNLGGEEYTVVVQSEADGATLRLKRNSQGQVLERHIASQDCRALADAIAVVVEAYFIEMRVPDLEPTNKAAGKEDSLGGTSTTTAFNSSPAPNLPELPALPAQNQALESASSIAPWPLVPPFQARTEALSEPLQAPDTRGFISKPSPPFSFEGFVGVGVALVLPDAKLTPAVEVGAGVDLPRVPISTELALSTTAPTTSGSGLDRVRRWGSEGVFRVGVPWVGALLYRPWLGLGLSAARLQALDVPAAPTKTSVTSIAEAGLEFAWPLGTSWHGRFDVSCVTLVYRDTYRVEPDGEIGRGPRFVCTTLIGVGWGRVFGAR